MAVTSIIADYHNATHAQDLLRLLNAYAQDPMGGNAPLSDYSQQNLIAALAKLPNAFSVLTYVDGQAAGMANCFYGFSTFKCRPLINIHDLAVDARYRGQGISQVLLDSIEQIAREQDCCKITLEVLEGNQVAKNAYLKFGFAGYELNPDMGKALFWEKAL